MFDKRKDTVFCTNCAQNIGLKISNINNTQTLHNKLSSCVNSASVKIIIIMHLTNFATDSNLSIHGATFQSINITGKQIKGV